MLRYIAACPYCQSVIGIDVISLTIVFDPGYGSSLPCRHLACFSAALNYEPLMDRTRSRTSVCWTWDLESGLHSSAGKLEDDLWDFMLDFPTDFSRPYLRPTVKYRIVGMTAEDRERARPGSGCFRVLAGTGDLYRGALDGFAIFSRRPVAVWRQVLAAIAEHEEESRRENGPEVYG